VTRTSEAAEPLHAALVRTIAADPQPAALCTPPGESAGDEAAERLLAAVAAQAQGHRYTLHLDFTTDNAAKALALAAALADGMSLLRPEVDAYTARLSVPGTPDEPKPVFCAATGPEGALCGDFYDHPGRHAEAGINGLRWGEGDGTRG